MENENKPFRNFDSLDWNKISKNIKLSNYIIIDLVVDRLNWDLITDRIDTDCVEFLLKYKNYINWNKIKYEALNENIIDKLSDKLNWDKVSQFTKLSSYSYDKYADKLNWNLVTINYNIPRCIVEKYADKLDWKYYSNKSMAYDFLEKHIDRIDLFLYLKSYCE